MTESNQQSASQPKRLRVFRVLFRKNGRVAKREFPSFSRADRFARHLRFGVLKGIVGVWQ